MESSFLFWDKIIAAFFQLAFIAGVVFFVDKLLGCCRSNNNDNNPIRPPAVRGFIPVPNAM